MPSENLPENFELNTVMHLGNDDWQVIKAEPMTAQEFKQTGQLRLSMSKVVTVNAQEILFSLPTICNEIPEASPNSHPSAKPFTLHEDDWRQLEFISSSQKDLALADLQLIQMIYQNHRVGVGFNQIHVRDRIHQAIL